MRLVVVLICIIMSVSSFSYAIEREVIKNEINKLTGNEYQNKYEILKVIEAKNVCAVFLQPPYREFPNVILFRLNNGKYQRIIESLSIGIVDAKSDVLDLHTKGYGVDFQTDHIDNYIFESTIVRKTITFGAIHNTPLCIYANFIHMHTIPGVTGFYTIDKTKFLNIASKIYGEKYWARYPANCIMYDLPKIINMNFKFENNKYIIIGETDNKQKWIISFSGFDDQNEFLLNKTIETK